MGEKNEECLKPPPEWAAIMRYMEECIQRHGCDGDVRYCGDAVSRSIIIAFGHLRTSPFPNRDSYMCYVIGSAIEVFRNRPLDCPVYSISLYDDRFPTRVDSMIATMWDTYLERVARRTAQMKRLLPDVLKQNERLHGH
jgi:hypothetical protein